MRIELRIKYWTDEILTFDPEKVLDRLKKYFLHVDIDPKDYSQEELERFVDHANKNIEEPTRSIVINQMQGKNRTNGPVFRFKIVLNKKTEITGFTNRYHIEFKSEEEFDSNSEKIIIDFFKSLNYGQIISNKQTTFFSKASERITGEWLLEDEYSN